MLSHLWSCKRDGARLPPRYASLQAIVNAMAAVPTKNTPPQMPSDDDSDVQSMPGIWGAKCSGMVGKASVGS